MGYWDATCAVTGIPIIADDDDPVVMVTFKKPYWNRVRIGHNGFLHFPLAVRRIATGIYNGYGRLESDDSLHTEENHEEIEDLVDYSIFIFKETWKCIMAAGIPSGMPRELGSPFIDCEEELKKIEENPMEVNLDPNFWDRMQVSRDEVLQLMQINHFAYAARIDLFASMRYNGAQYRRQEHFKMHELRSKLTAQRLDKLRAHNAKYED